LTALDFFARWRVRLGYLLGVAALVLARPTPRAILIGAWVGMIGLGIRAYAAGVLRKQEILTMTGPYAYTRNPLYFGSSFLAAGAAIAMHSWGAAAIVLGYFALVYTLVMRREEMELGAKHTVAFEEYAKAVPLFFPQLTAAKSAGGAGGFSATQYKKNHEYQAAVGFFLLFVVLTGIWWLRAH
jgi:protein-S-isoprenylcysteine O-methyltransferase Ste14